MLKPLMRTLVAMVLGFLVTLLAGEVSLFPYHDWHYAPLPSWTHRVHPFMLSPRLRGESSFSAGNKSYWYLRIQHGKRQVFDWWGTAALFSEPKVWLEPGADFPRLLTYQPYISGDRSTPLGTIECGYQLWTFDGRAYLPQPLPVHPINLFLRSPVPVQD